MAGEDFTAPKPPAPTQALRTFTDIPQIRDNIFSGVLDAVKTKYPIENDRYKLEIVNPRYDSKPFSLADQKDAILKRKTLDWKIKGTWRLTNKLDNSVVGEIEKIIARVPYMTERGTFIHSGSEYTIANQLRLRPGVYARKTDAGTMESHFNLMPGTGHSFRIHMEPETGLFKAHIGQADIPLLPLLRGLGASDAQIADAWGTKLLQANAAKEDPRHLTKLYQKFGNPKIMQEIPDAATGLRKVFDKMAIDPEIALRNLGKPHAKVSHEAILDATRKLLRISRKEDDPDDRDSLGNQTFHTPEDLFRERVDRDTGGVGRRLLWKSTLKNGIDHIPSGALTPQVNGVLLSSGLGMPLTEINPIEILGQLSRVTRLGEGGISGGVDSIPDSARNVSPSQLGLVDPVIGPESEAIGVDARLAVGTMRGPSNQLMREVTNIRTGKPEVVGARTLVHSTLAFPGEMNDPEKKLVRAMVNGKAIRYVDRSKVDYAVAHPEHMFAPLANLVPMISGIKGGRLIMGAKMVSQALPLTNGEAPLVQTATPEDPNVSYEHKYGEFAGALRAKDAGTVVSVKPGEIKVRYADGKIQAHELYQNFPFNYKTQIHNEPVVAPGDRVTAGQTLAKSNFTDKNGTLALGLNLRTAFAVHRGMNFEDAIVISESAAKRLQSEHMHTVDHDHDADHEVNRNAFISLFPGKFNRQQIENIDEHGVIKPGSVVHKGDPLMLVINKRQPAGGQALHKVQRSFNADASHTWDHHNDGVVTDVSHDASGIKVAVKSMAPMRVADKLSNIFGGKGVVSTIVPDDQMPRGEDGKPFELLLNPQGLISRVNPAQLITASLGKIARKTGQPYRLRAFNTGVNMAQFVVDELKKHGLKETETIFDPYTNRRIPNVYTGEKFMMKLSHVAESKESGRDIGSYDQNEQPAKGGLFGAKRISGGDVAALVSHGMTALLRDAKTIRGQKNDEFWNAFRRGYHAPMPGSTFAYGKFYDTLRAAGINTEQRNDAIHIMALTDKDTTKLSRGALTSGDAINMKDGSPVKGGLFDTGLTGGAGGKNWTHLNLTEPLPSPVMEDPIRRLLNLTKPKFEELLSSPDGGKEIHRRLTGINVDDEIARQKEAIKGGKVSQRDAAVKALGILQMCKSRNLHPGDFMWNKVPVLPPVMRPVTQFNGMQLTSDANLLYKDLFEANETLSELKKDTTDVGQERLAVYHALKAVAGLGDPINVKHQEKGVGGMLLHAFGKGSAKHSDFQRSVLSNTLDTVGRAAVIPAPELDMDHVGLPESLAWKVYQPFVMRRMAKRFNVNVQGGEQVPLTEMAKWIANHDPRAREALIEEMKERPVIINRAPVLHRYGMMAAIPVLTPGEALRISPITCAGYNMDFDGDTSNYSVPVSDEAVKDAIAHMLPSKNLRAANDFQVHYLPRQEYLHGLYMATTDAKKGGEPRVFPDAASVLRAYKRGEISAQDQVKIAKF